MSQSGPETSADQAKKPRSTLVSRNVTIAGHRTSVRLEPDMWSGLSEICRREKASLHEICTSVATSKQDNTSLTAAIRVFVMAYFRAAATEDGHVRAGHAIGNNGGLMAVSNSNGRIHTSGLNTPLALATARMDGMRRF